MKLFYRCIRQHDSSDCACACLATIAQYFGKRIPLSVIRELMDVSKEGADIYEMCMAAEKIGLSTEALIKEEEFEERKLPFPCIAHVYQEDGMGHFIVLYKIRSNEIIIADPAIGIIKIDKKNFFNSIFSETSPYIWTGVIITLEPNEKFELNNENFSNRTNSYINMLISEKKKIFKIIFFSIIALAISIFTSFYFGVIVDGLIPYRLVYTLLLYTILMIVMILIKIVVDWIRAKESLEMSKALSMKLCLNYYNHVIKLPLSFFDSRKSGEIISRFQDANQVQEALIVAILVLPVDIIFIIIAGSILSHKSMHMFTIVLLMCIGYCITVLAFKRKYILMNSSLRVSQARVTTHLIDSMEGIQTIKAYSYEKNIYGQGNEKVAQWQNNVLKLGYTENVQNAIKAFINSVGEVAVLCVGACEVMNGDISVGELVTCNMLIGYLLSPLKDIVNLQSIYHSAQIAIERIESILDIEEEMKGVYEVENLSKITFNNVSYGFNSNIKAVENINLDIRVGNNIAIVGGTGSGKTTLAKLLMKFYVPSEGEIYINSKNLNSISIEFLRESITYVSQEDFIFTGSIKDNLKLGNSNISDREMKLICEAFGVDTFVKKMERGYESILDERGANLSKGQKQKISLARAVLKNPRILILDEATSNIDMDSERNILRYLYDETNITLVLISHRYDSVINSDHIYVLEQGKIIAEGTHDELLEKCELYRKNCVTEG